MESQRSWYLYIVVCSIIAVVSTKPIKDDMKDAKTMKTDEKEDYNNPFLYPTLSYYGNEYPYFLPGLFLSSLFSNEIFQSHTFYFN